MIVARTILYHAKREIPKREMKLTRSFMTTMDDTNVIKIPRENVFMAKHEKSRLL
jgi:hypothetical protein